jgi:hypothetical protein
MFSKCLSTSLIFSQECHSFNICLAIAEFSLSRPTDRVFSYGYFFFPYVKKSKLNGQSVRLQIINANMWNNTWGMVSNLMHLNLTVVTPQSKCIFTVQLRMPISEHGAVWALA